MMRTMLRNEWPPGVPRVLALAAQGVALTACNRGEAEERPRWPKHCTKIRAGRGRTRTWTFGRGHAGWSIQWPGSRSVQGNRLIDHVTSNRQEGARYLLSRSTRDVHNALAQAERTTSAKARATTSKRSRSRQRLLNATSHRTGSGLGR